MNATVSRGRARAGRLVVFALVLLSFVVVPAHTAGATGGYPDSMAALGDSITRAYNTGSSSFTDAPVNSWSTGVNSTFDSHYELILAADTTISGNFNYAKTGAKMVDLNAQATMAVSQGVEYVTILMGANDVCTSSESTMTPVATFREQFDTAMRTLTTGLPGAQIYVVSIPNVYQLWELHKGTSSARATWQLFQICQSMLKNPLSTKKADVDRRERVWQREKDFNIQLKDVCDQYASQCRFDFNAVFDTDFTKGDVSTRDYFHPSLAGQAKLASVSWNEGYWGQPRP